MRKVGLITLLSGLVLSVLLFLVRQGGWFAAEIARGMSDFAELVESAFWAALVTAAFGLLLVLLSLRPTERAPENEAPAPLVRTWVCPACGAENTDSDLRCGTCGTPHSAPAPPSWRCAAARRPSRRTARATR